jgi:hypothetical protein
MAEGHMCGQYTTHEWGGGSGGVTLKFMLTILVFEIKEGNKK